MHEKSTDAASVVVALSSERMQPYLRTVNGDVDRALVLYRWNLAASSALYEVLGILEVVLRNALSKQLEAMHANYDTHWYEDPLGLFSDQAHDDIAQARFRLRQLGRRETSGRIVAELNFGFWKFLLAKRYEATLWTKHLRHAFPGMQPQTRASVYRHLDDLHVLRNRIAHHEPIHVRDLKADVTAISRLLQWMNADVREWSLARTRLPGLIRARPT